MIKTKNLERHVYSITCSEMWWSSHPLFAYIHAYGIYTYTFVLWFTQFRDGKLPG